MRIKKFLSMVNNFVFDGYSIKSYSQEGEDMILRRLFENKKNGFYVDVGAHHPKRFSNTWYFYKKGWAGINIDAMPGSMRMFNIFRPRDINIEKPVSCEKKVLSYFVFNEPALNGFSKELSVSRDGYRHYKIEKTIEIEALTLNDILNENLPENKIIDFISIDVEGLEYDVIQSIDFKKYKPKVVLIEILDLDLEKVTQDVVCKYLISNGFSVYAKTVNTLFFIHESFDVYKKRKIG